MGQPNAGAPCGVLEWTDASLSLPQQTDFPLDPVLPSSPPREHGSEAAPRQTSCMKLFVSESVSWTPKAQSKHRHTNFQNQLCVRRRLVMCSEGAAVLGAHSGTTSCATRCFASVAGRQRPHAGWPLYWMARLPVPVLCDLVISLNLSGLQFLMSNGAEKALHSKFPVSSDGLFVYNSPFEFLCFPL